MVNNNKFNEVCVLLLRELKYWDIFFLAVSKKKI